MSESEFYRSGTGREFYQRTLPAIAKNLGRIAEAMEKNNARDKQIRELEGAVRVSVRYIFPPKELEVLRKHAAEILDISKLAPDEVEPAKNILIRLGLTEKEI